MIILKDEKQRLVNSVKSWWHTIDFGDGIFSPGAAGIDGLNRLASYIPSVVGKSVLDIGAWDGFFSFKAEEKGAVRVVALDKPVWEHEFSKDGVKGPFPDTLPGKRGFDVASKIKNSSVECVVADLEETGINDLGSFDVVLFFGVWYHLKNPYTIVEKLFKLTNEIVVLETQAIYVDGFEDMALMEFYDDDLNGDKSNWFAFNLCAIKKMFKAAGFKDIEVVSEYPPRDKPRCRLSCRVYK